MAVKLHILLFLLRTFVRKEVFLFMSNDIFGNSFGNMQNDSYPGFSSQPFGSIGDTGESKLAPLDTYADIVYCIDLTGSMLPVINKVKQTAKTLHEKLQSAMIEKYNRKIVQLRIKVIGFRDIYDNGESAFEESGFFNLPTEAKAFQDYVDGLQAKDGGDVPENSLEALAKAMHTDWCETIDSTIKKRNIIVLFTDAPAHPFEKSKNYKGKYYPENMPSSYQGFNDMWYNLNHDVPCYVDQAAKRLAVFAPESQYPWADVREDFNATYFHPIVANNGGSDITTDDLIKTICETLR